MDQNSRYVKDIQSRSKSRFVLGALARVKRYLQNSYAVRVARKKGATIGSHVSMPLALAKKANANLKVGNHTSIQTDKLDMRAPVMIGSYVIIGSNTEIITCSHNIDSPDWEFKAYGIEVADYVWIATNILVLPSCRMIGHGAVVGSGSVLAKNVEMMQIVAGNPAVFLRERKEVHYNLCVEALLGNDLRSYLNARKNKFD